MNPIDEVMMPIALLIVGILCLWLARVHKERVYAVVAVLTLAGCCISGIALFRTHAFDGLF